MKLRHQYKDIEDFLEDDKFVAWVIDPTDASSAYWNQWLADTPHQQQTAQAAIAIIKNVYAVEDQFKPNVNTEEIWEKIKKDTLITKKTTPKSKYWLRGWMKYAAVLIFLIALSIFFFKEFGKDNLTEKVEKTEWILEDNVSGIIKKIKLSDGSLVLLEPFSSLKYPRIFNKKRRDVFLEGEAFFDIERDTASPFFIFANETITTVLGTSFTIKAFNGDKNVEVKVKTGKVAVYAAENANEKTKKMIVRADETIYIPKPNRKLEITPNQMVIFDKKKKELVRTIAPIPKLIKESVNQVENLKFENAPLEEIFIAMQLAYGIEIVFDKNDLQNCTINTALTDVPMLDKIDMICKALSLKYEEKDGKIFIVGTGCD